MKDKFTKSDLKDGMIVKTRDFLKSIVLKDRIIGINGAMGLEEYGEDLLLCEDSRDAIEDEYDIMAVYEFCSDGKYPTISDLLNGNAYLKLIWERKEVKRMTAKEMKTKLEELTGERIEIIPSRGEMIEEINCYCEDLDKCDDCMIKKECDSRGDFDCWSNKQLRECYERVMEDGRKES